MHRGRQPRWQVFRLYPVPFRNLDDDQKFKKYQWIRVRVRRPAKGDTRPETVRPDFSTIELLGRRLPAGDWASRRDVVMPLRSASMCNIQDAQERDGTSIGFFRPAEVLDVDVDVEREESPHWTPGELQLLTQQDFFLPKDKPPLDKIPVGFYYRFRCESCRNKGPHRMKIVDWELAQLWRKQRRGHDEDTVIQQVRDRFLSKLCGPTKDTHFFTGNMASHRASFLILGVFWPPKTSQGDLFEATPTPNRS